MKCPNCNNKYKRIRKSINYCPNCGWKETSKETIKKLINFLWKS